MKGLLVLLAIIGVGASIIGVFSQPAVMARAWLAPTLFWVALPLGALAILLTHRLTGGRWGDAAEPPLRAATATLPWAALALLALLPAMGALFSWTAPLEQLPEVVQRKRFYLNTPFFIARLLVYLAVWLLLAWHVGAFGAPRGGKAVAPAGLLLWLFTVSFFAFDWVMSLEPKWYSDVLGLIMATTVLNAAMALVLLTLCLEDRPPPAAIRVDLANLWLAPLLGWGFLAFIQYLIIWQGNLPHEIGWYLHRRHGLWQPWTLAMTTLLFLLPAAALLFAGTKRSRAALGSVATIALVGHALHSQWLITPSFQQYGPGWRDAAAWAAILGLGGLCYLTALDRLNPEATRHG